MIFSTTLKICYIYRLKTSIVTVWPTQKLISFSSVFMRKT